MNSRVAGIFLVVVLSALVSGAATVEHIGADRIEVSLDFDRAEFFIEQIGDYHHIRGEDLAQLPLAGSPSLPVKAYHVAIPGDLVVTGIDVSSASEAALPGSYWIAPVQPPAPLSEGPASWVEGDPEIYGRDGLYPSDPVRGLHQGFMGSNRIVSFQISPLRWNPATGRLYVYENLRLTLRLSRATTGRRFHARSAESDAFTAMVERTVLNGTDVRSFSRSSQPHRILGQSMLADGEFDYVVVTADSMASAFEPLIQWKTERGIAATCVTREWIEANYTGSIVDDQIRNFIRDAHETWGTIWVLLGGDTKIVPSRRVYAMDAEMGPNGNRIRCDLFYADLDGTWNANGVDPYGEIADSIDMYPDLYIGRAPAENAAEAVVFVDKVLTYEKNPPEDYALKMLMAGEIMWTHPYTDGGVGLDMIDADCVPPRFDPITKLYESLGNESPESVLGAMSAGQNFVLHDGHCSEDVMGAGTGYIYWTHADTLTNNPKNFILNSIGCWPAAVDRDCIAEHFMNNPNGGCVAFIGNSRYGWGSPGNPGFGYSDKFQYEFARSVFVDESVRIGQAHAESKVVFVGFAGGENVYRWNEFQLNLLGDPEMPLWTDEPSGLTVSAPDRVMATGDELTVVVEDASGSVGGALVCVMNGEDLYLRATTDPSGLAAFSVSTAYPDSLVLTVTAPNRLHHQERIEVVYEGIALAWTQATVVDGGDGMANPGETVEIDVLVKNSGTEAGEGVWGVLRDESGLCAITDSTVYFGEIGAGQEVLGNGFTVEFDPSLVNGDVVVFDLTLTDTLSDEWALTLPLPVATPVMSVASYGIDDEAGGDGDWVIEPGEVCVMTLQIYNQGLTYGSADVTLTSLDPDLAVADSVTSTGQVGAGAYGLTRHLVTVDPLCPVTHVGGLEALISYAGGGSVTDTVYFTVGNLAFTDDCEAGEGDWTRSGAPDLWHLSTYRAHSGSTSWYYGDSETHMYPDGTNSTIRSRTFVAGEDNRLSFWYWYDFTTYGTDGLYAIVEIEGAADTLDFIGSGGALDGTSPLNIVSDWVPWEFELAGAQPGDSVVIALAFISDNSDNAEGIYIDDIALSSKTPEITGVGDIVQDMPACTFKARPNPAGARTAISFAADAGAVSLDVYDIQGRLVVSLVKPVGSRSIEWDLTDLNGKRVAPGIYMAKASGKQGSFSRKIVVLR
jgi:hypothetical protein